MLLTTWAGRRQIALKKLRGKRRGVFAELVVKTALNARTVTKAARDGIGVTYEAAEALSAATDGACSIDEIRFPERYKRTRAA